MPVAAEPHSGSLGSAEEEDQAAGSEDAGDRDAIGSVTSVIVKTQGNYNCSSTGDSFTPLA